MNRIILPVIAALAAGIVIGIFAAQQALVAPGSEPFPLQAPADETAPAGLVPANVSIDGATITLANACSEISFEVTEDQAFSIARGMEGTLAPRPLAHDIFADVARDFGISVSAIKIDRFEDGIYKAGMTLQQGNRTLDIDLRPSDAIALAARLGRNVYIEAGIMKAQSVEVC